MRDAQNSDNEWKNKYEELEKNFKALAAENRENRSLVEAAKPRQAELERIKLRLLEIDQLKNSLAKEMQLNSELKSAYNQDHNELLELRKKAEEFEDARRKLVALEAVSKENERLNELKQLYLKKFFG